MIKQDPPSSRFQQVERLFLAALDQPAAERSGFLRARCDGDDDLLHEVEQMLAADAAADSAADSRDGSGTGLSTGLTGIGALEKAIGTQAAALAAATDSAQGEPTLGSRLGERLGNYQLLSELGRGGMSVVYLAARSDDEYEQKVAIKLIAPSFLGEELRQRLLAERQILARLQHPHIARLLDGGTTPDGTPTS